MEGLEPAYLSALDPKSSVSTNFTTSAKILSSKVSFNFAQNPKLNGIEGCKDKDILKIQKILFILFSISNRLFKKEIIY